MFIFVNFSVYSFEYYFMSLVLIILNLIIIIMMCTISTGYTSNIEVALYLTFTLFTLQTWLFWICYLQPGMLWEWDKGKLAAFSNWPFIVKGRECGVIMKHVSIQCNYIATQHIIQWLFIIFEGCSHFYILYKNITY